MAHPIWQGNLSFGLINIPISLYTAISRQDLKFRFLHKVCGTPIEYRKYCPKCKKEVEWEEVVRGYEHEKGKFVILSEVDFEKADIELTKTIDIVDFVSLTEIEPYFFDRPYYLVPQKGAAKTYHLLVRALQEDKKVGIAKVVIKTREYLAAIVPIEGGLLLETLYFDYEIKKLKDYELPSAPALADKEIKLAKQIIEELTEKFNPKSYTDTYRQKLLEIIKKKAAGKKVTVPTEREEISAKEFEDLMAALKESMAEIKKEKTKV